MIGHINSGSKTLRETRVLLLRHAETSAPDRFHGAESDVGLGENGRNQAEAAARALASRRPDALYCSAMRRARETAAPIGRACGLVPEAVETLHERKVGKLSGQLRADGWADYAETKARWADGELDFTRDGGESYNDIRRRVVPAFQELADRNPGKTLILVTHGWVIRVLLTSLIEGLGPADFDAIAINHVAINELAYDGRHWRMVALDQTPEGAD
jgi:2,3-bisphosphoglycerate-dependent phosphoglycerate mutase